MRREPPLRAEETMKKGSPPAIRKVRYDLKRRATVSRRAAFFSEEFGVILHAEGAGVGVLTVVCRCRSAL